MCRAVLRTATLRKSFVPRFSQKLRLSKIQLSEVTIRYFFRYQTDESGDPSTQGQEPGSHKAADERN